MLLGPVEIELIEDETCSPATFEVAAKVEEGDVGTLASLILPDGTRVEVTEGAITIGRNRDNC